MSGLFANFSGRLGAFALDAGFEAPPGVTALFGPSGSGKTTILRAIAGLTRLAGTVRLGETTWQEGRTFVPPHRRPLGYVFQEPSLFPHLSVRRNLDFGRAAAVDFDDAVAMLGLAPLIERDPKTLSGGERQRVALGRALLTAPQLLLLDEPMSALDRDAKAEILPYLETLCRYAAMPVILVSHDIAEVERLADRMVLLREGRVVEAGPLNTVLTGDENLWRRRDAAAVIAAQLSGYDPVDDLSSLTVGGQTLLVAGRAGVAGDRVRLRIAARDVSLAVEKPSQTTILNCLSVEIAAIAPLEGAEAAVTLRLAGQTLLARVTRRSLRTLALAPGQKVFAQVKGVSLVAG